MPVHLHKLLQLGLAEYPQLGEDLPGEFHGAESAGGDDAAIANGESVLIERRRLVAGGVRGQECLAVAGVAALAEAAGPGEGYGGGADAGDRDRARLQRPERGGQCIGRLGLEPGVAAGEQEEPGVVVAEVGEREIGDDPESAHGGDGADGVADSDHGDVAPAAEAGERERRLPVREAVEDERRYAGAYRWPNGLGGTVFR